MPNVDKDVDKVYIFLLRHLILLLQLTLVGWVLFFFFQKEVLFPLLNLFKVCEFGNP